MPLGVVQRPNKNEIGKLSGVVSVAGQVYDLYQKIQKNKYQKNRISGVVSGLNTPFAFQGEAEEEEKALTEVPEEILAPKGLEKFSKDLAAKIAEKRKLFGGLKLPNGQAVVEGTGIDQPDMNTIYNAVSELPLTGDVPFSDLTNMIFKNFDKNWSPLAETMLSQVLGAGMSELTADPSAQVNKNIALTDDVKSVLFPDQVAPKEATSEWKQWQNEHPGKGIEDYWKAKNPDIPFDEEKFKAENPEFELASQSSTGTKTYRRKEGDNAKKITPTFEIINSVKEALLDPEKDYDTEMHNAEIKYDFTGVELPTKADQAKNAIDQIPNLLLEKEIIGEDGFIKDEEGYRDFYKDYEKYSEIFFKETGTIPEKKFLSPEEAGKFTKFTYGTGEKGGFKPITNKEETPWAWESNIDYTQALGKDMERKGTTVDDYDLEGLATKLGIDVNILREKLKKKE